MKTDTECAELILTWATNNLVAAERQNVKFTCDEQGRRESERLWAETNPDDGVGCASANPYRLRADRTVERDEMLNYLDQARSMMAFVRKRICQGLVEV